MCGTRKSSRSVGADRLEGVLFDGLDDGARADALERACAAARRASGASWAAPLLGRKADDDEVNDLTTTTTTAAKTKKRGYVSGYGAADGGRGRRRRGPRVAEPRRLREPPLQAQAHVADVREDLCGNQPLGYARVPKSDDLPDAGGQVWAIPTSGLVRRPSAELLQQTADAMRDEERFQI
ncbi:hypothetical protein JL720_1771 [Aureococcus anophagefferens]|nr:hypothetical protein JL720_1771 [Aureococcus anophagefferens]